MPYRFAHWLILMLIVLTVPAFWRSYLSDLSSSRIELHVHGVTASIWMALLAIQSWAIHNRHRRLHSTLGKASFVLFPFLLVGFGLVEVSWARNLIDGTSEFHNEYGARIGAIHRSVLRNCLFLLHGSAHTAQCRTPRGIHDRYCGVSDRTRRAAPSAACARHGHGQPGGMVYIKPCEVWHCLYVTASMGSGSLVRWQYAAASRCGATDKRAAAVVGDLGCLVMVDQRLHRAWGRQSPRNRHRSLPVWLLRSSSPAGARSSLGAGEVRAPLHRSVVGSIFPVSRASPARPVPVGAAAGPQVEASEIGQQRSASSWMVLEI